MANPGSKWRNDPRGPYIRMHSGRKFYLLDPEFHIPDVAYHLARIHRYTGASEMSVAQHCVVASWMAQEFYPEHPVLPARMVIHDTTEHALGDVSSPLKSLLPEYKRIEMEHEAAAERFFGTLFIGDPIVKEVDDRMWLTERLAVYGHCGDISEDYSGPLEPFPLDEYELASLFQPWAPNTAEHRWLTELYEQLPWMK